MRRDGALAVALTAAALSGCGTSPPAGESERAIAAAKDAYATHFVELDPDGELIRAR